MKDNKSKNIIIGFLLGIVVILLILTGLFATGTISFNINDSNSNIQSDDNNLKNEQNQEKEPLFSEDFYSEFLRTKGYKKDFTNNETLNDVKYTYYDFDNNGIEELIIYISDESDFGTNLFYTYEDNQIKFIDKIYHFGNLSYDKKDGSIVYTAVKPSLAYGYSYVFYKLNNNKFELIKSATVSISNNIETYFINDKEITKDEYDKYFENIVSFEYINLDV